MKNTSKGYLTVVSRRLFLRVKINYVTIFASKILSPPPSKFLHQMRFTSFSVDYAMNPITENVLTSCCKKFMNILVFHL